MPILNKICPNEGMWEDQGLCMQNREGSTYDNDEYVHDIDKKRKSAHTL